LTNEQTFVPPFNTAGSANFAVRFTGYIYAPSAGMRYFGVNSDDGFSLHINGQFVGEFPDARAPATTDVTNVTLPGTMTFDFPAAGSYYLVLDYFENGGGECVELFQTDSVGGNRRLINIDAELVVFRDDVTRINGTNIVVAGENTINCWVDVDGAEPGTWNAIVTPQCGDAAKGTLDDALGIVASMADFNGDSKVNFFDYAELADIWRKVCFPSGACDDIDTDNSGQVDFGDLAVIAEEWLLGV
jgi:hypothetical protein